VMLEPLGIRIESGDFRGSDFGLHCNLRSQQRVERLTDDLLPPSYPVLHLHCKPLYHMRSPALTGCRPLVSQTAETAKGLRGNQGADPRLGRHVVSGRGLPGYSAPWKDRDRAFLSSILSTSCEAEISAATFPICYGLDSEVVFALAEGNEKCPSERLFAWRTAFFCG